MLLTFVSGFPIFQGNVTWIKIYIFLHIINIFFKTFNGFINFTNKPLPVKIIFRQENKYHHQWKVSGILFGGSFEKKIFWRCQALIIVEGYAVNVSEWKSNMPAVLLSSLDIKIDSFDCDDQFFAHSSSTEW